MPTNMTLYVMVWRHMAQVYLYVRAYSRTHARTYGNTTSSRTRPEQNRPEQNKPIHVYILPHAITYIKYPIHTIPCHSMPYITWMPSIPCRPHMPYMTYISQRNTRHDPERPCPSLSHPTPPDPTKPGCTRRDLTRHGTTLRNAYNE